MNLSVKTLSSNEVNNFVTHLLHLTGHDPDLIRKEIRFIDWWFFSRDQDRNVLAAAFAADGEPAGYVGYARTELARGTTSVPAAILSSAMTNPQLRGQGVFSHLMNYLIEQAAQAGIDVLYGSPNRNSCRIFISRLGFTGLFHWHRYARPIRWDPLGARFGAPGQWIARTAGRISDMVIPLRVKGYGYTTSQELPVDFDAFMAKAVQPAACHLARSPDYCRWRFSRPDRQYQHVILRDQAGQLAGWAAVDRVQHGKRSRLHIGDYWIVGNETRTLRALVAAVREIAAENGDDEIYTAGRTCSRTYDLRRLGFIRKRSQTPIVVISPTGRDLAQVLEWEFRDTDVDMF